MPVFAILRTQFCTVCHPGAHHRPKASKNFEDLFLHTHMTRGSRRYKHAQSPWRPPHTLPPAAFDHATARIGPTTTKIEFTIDDEADDDLLRCQLQRKLIGPSVLLLIIAYK